MYTVENTPEEITLQSAGSTVKILPAHGAILNEWKVKTATGETDVIDGYEDTRDFEENVEEKGFRSCKLSPYVCRLYMRTYAYRGQRYHIGKFIQNGSALHGLLYDEKFDLKNEHMDQQSASVTLGYSYTGGDEGFPFPFTMDVIYELETGNSLRLTTMVTNTGTATMPIADGWHPYFKLGGKLDECSIRIASATQVEFNDKLIPTGSLLKDGRFEKQASLDGVELDNCFVVEGNHANNWVCQLENDRAGLALDIYAEQNYPYLQMYTPPHRNSIAIENLSGTPDCFNNGMGLMELAAGESARFVTRYKITIKDQQ